MIPVREFSKGGKMGSTVKYSSAVVCACAIILAACGEDGGPATTRAGKTAYDFLLYDINGGSIDLAAFKGKNVAMFVNTATECGLTPQFIKLQALYEKYRDRGFVVIGFPSNTFKQEPRAEQEIVTFCNDNFLVDFPLTAKTDVKGENKNPLYIYLTNPANFSSFPREQAEISWNFEKFIIDRNGKIVARFKPEVEPDDPAIIAAVESVLKEVPE